MLPGCLEVLSVLRAAALINGFAFGVIVCIDIGQICGRLKVIYTALFASNCPTTPPTARKFSEGEQLCDNLVLIISRSRSLSEGNPFYMEPSDASDQIVASNVFYAPWKWLIYRHLPDFPWDVENSGRRVSNNYNDALDLPV